jgi:hypothetical protein
VSEVQQNGRRRLTDIGTLILRGLAVAVAAYPLEPTHNPAAQMLRDTFIRPVRFGLRCALRQSLSRRATTLWPLDDRTRLAMQRHNIFAVHRPILRRPQRRHRVGVVVGVE